MPERTITVNVTCDDDEYLAIANLLWHVLYFSKAEDFDVYPDGRQSAQELNDYWDNLGEEARWPS